MDAHRIHDPTHSGLVTSLATDACSVTDMGPSPVPMTRYNTELRGQEMVSAAKLHPGLV